MDKVSPEERSRMMSHVRSTDTQPEIKVRSFLHRSRLRFRLHCRNLPGSVSRWPRRSGSAGGHCQVLHVCGRHGDLMPFPRPSADVTCCSSRLLCLFVARRVEPFAAVTGPRLTPSRPGERRATTRALLLVQGSQYRAANSFHQPSIRSSTTDHLPLCFQGRQGPIPTLSILSSVIS